MELLNHFVASRLMKDAQLFERIGQYDATPPLLAKPVDSTAPPADDRAANCPNAVQQPGSRPRAVSREL
jgi:hypothetical protein